MPMLRRADRKTITTEKFVMQSLLSGN